LGISIQVRKKKFQTEKGSTPYSFTYSFKGEAENHPIVPQSLSTIAQRMSEKILSQNVTLIALDRGGTALGVAVSLCSGLPLYIAFSYWTQPPQNWISWEEKGAGKSLAIPPLTPNTHVVVIDDEINTGLTYVDACKELSKKSIIVDQIITVCEVEKTTLGKDIINQYYPNIHISSLFTIPEPIHHEDNFYFQLNS